MTDNLVENSDSTRGAFAREVHATAVPKTMKGALPLIHPEGVKRQRTTSLAALQAILALHFERQRSVTSATSKRFGQAECSAGCANIEDGAANSRDCSQNCLLWRQVRQRRRRSIKVSAMLLDPQGEHSANITVKFGHEVDKAPPVPTSRKFSDIPPIEHNVVTTNGPGCQNCHRDEIYAPTTLFRHQQANLCISFLSQFRNACDKQGLVQGFTMWLDQYIVTVISSET